MRPTSALLACVAALASPAFGQNSRTPPIAPANVQASVGPQQAVTLTWTDRSSDERGFRIVREVQTSPNHWSESAGFSVGPNVTSYQDHPAPGTYRYRVRAWSIRGNSSYIAAAPILVSAASLVPAAPSGLTVVDDGNGVAHLTWTDESNNETGFEIERQPVFPSGATQTVGPNTPSWLDQTPGGVYSYRVRATSGAGDSGFTPWIRSAIATPLGGVIPPAPPAIIPGHGFGGATPPPPPVGDPAAPGYDATSIARWDVVPFQTFTSDFNVGVVAFHINGIDRVEFSANGGPWVAARQMMLNPQTNVWEYTARLRAADFTTDGPVEVRAIAWPRVGQARVLEGIVFTANKQGSYSSPQVYVATTGDDTNGNGTANNPFRTLYKALQYADTAGGSRHADGADVLLAPGSYEWVRPNGSWTPVTTTRWATIEPGPGTPADQVTLTNAPGGAIGGMYTKLVRLHNLTVSAELDTSVPLEDYLWLDSCHIAGAGPLDNNTYWAIPDWTAVYATDSSATNMVNAFLFVSLARGCQVDTLYADGFPGSVCVINCTVVNQIGGAGAGGQSYHSDIWQERAPTTDDNVILYGLTAQSNCVGQGIFTRGDVHSNVAIVNCSFDLHGYPDQNQWISQVHHLYVAYNSFLGTAFNLGLSDSSLPTIPGYFGSTNALWRNNAFQWIALSDDQARSGTTSPHYAQLRPQTTFSNNHFVNQWPAYTGSNGTPWNAQVLGDNATVGLQVPPGRGAYGSSPPPR